MHTLASLASKLRSMTREEGMRDALCSSSLASLLAFARLPSTTSFCDDKVGSPSAATSVVFSLISSVISGLDKFSSLPAEDQQAVCSLAADSICALANYAAHDALKEYAYAPITTRFPSVTSGFTLLLRLAASLECLLFPSPILVSYFRDDLCENASTTFPPSSLPLTHTKALLSCFGYVAVALSNLGTTDEDDLTLTIAPHINSTSFEVDLTQLPPVFLCSHYSSLITTVLLHHLIRATPSILHHMQGQHQEEREEEEDEETSLFSTSKDTLAMCISHLSVSLPEIVTSDFPLSPLFLTSALTTHVSTHISALLSPENTDISENSLKSSFSAISTTNLPPVPANIVTILHKIVSCHPELFSPRSTVSFAPILPTLAALLSESTRFSLSTFPKIPEHLKTPSFASILAGPMVFAADIAKILLVEGVKRQNTSSMISLDERSTKIPSTEVNFTSFPEHHADKIDIVMYNDASLLYTFTHPPALPAEGTFTANTHTNAQAEEADEVETEEDEEEEEEEPVMDDVSVSPLSTVTAVGHCVQACLHAVLLGQHAIPDSNPGNPRNSGTSGFSVMVNVLVSSLHQYILPTVTLSMSMKTLYTQSLSSHYTVSSSLASTRYALQVGVALAQVTNDILSLLSPIALSPALAVVFIQHYSSLTDYLFLSLLHTAQYSSLPAFVSSLYGNAENKAVIKKISVPTWLPMLPSRALSILGFLLGHRGKNSFSGTHAQDHHDPATSTIWSIPEFHHSLSAEIPEKLLFSGIRVSTTSFPIYLFPEFALALIDTGDNLLHRVLLPGKTDSSENTSKFQIPKLYGADKLTALESVLTTFVNLLLATTTNISPSQSPTSVSQSPPVTDTPLRGSVQVWMRLLSGISSNIRNLLRIFTVGWDGENQRFSQLRQYIDNGSSDTNITDTSVDTQHDDVKSAVYVLTQTYIQLTTQLSSLSQSPNGLSQSPMSLSEIPTMVCCFDDVPGYVLQHKLPLLQLLLLRMLRCLFSRAVDDMLSLSATTTTITTTATTNTAANTSSANIASTASTSTSTPAGMISEDLGKYLTLLTPEIFPDLLSSLLSLTSFCQISHLKYEAARLFGLFCRYISLLPKDLSVPTQQLLHTHTPSIPSSSGATPASTSTATSTSTSTSASTSAPASTSTSVSTTPVSVIQSIFTTLVSTPTPLASTPSSASSSSSSSLAHSLLLPLLSVDAQQTPTLAVLAVEGREAEQALQEMGVSL